MVLSPGVKKAIVALTFVVGTSGAAAARPQALSPLTGARVGRSTIELRFSFDLGRDQFQGFDWTSPSLPAAGESMGQGNSYGIWMFVRTNRYFDLFMEMGYHRTRFLVGAEGETLTGGYFDDNGPYNLWEDVFYRSNNLMLRLGGRFIYPIGRSIEPWVGLAYGLNVWNVSFFNQDESDYYSDVIWGVNKASFFFLTGVDFILRVGEKRLLTIGLFLDLGRSTASPLTIDNYFYSIPWTYDKAPGIPAWKFGISIGGGV